MSTNDGNATGTIQSVSREARLFPPSKGFTAGALINDVVAYEKQYRRSIDDPEGFWAETARAELRARLSRESRRSARRRGRRRARASWLDAKLRDRTRRGRRLAGTGAHDVDGCGRGRGAIVDRRGQHAHLVVVREHRREQSASVE